MGIVYTTIPVRHLIFCRLLKLKGLSLDWSLTEGHFSKRWFSSSLKGILPTIYSIVYEIQDLANRYTQAEIITQIFDRNEHVLPKYAGWNKEDWYCIDCLKVFVVDHLHIWIRETRRAGIRFLYPDIVI